MSNYVTAEQAAFRLSPSNSAYINQLSVAGTGRSLHLAIALGIAACAMVSMPGGQVDSPEDYFVQQGAENAADAVAVINELVPVDYRTAMDIAKKLFLVRYELAYKPFTAFGIDRREGLASIFGLNAHIPENVLDCMRHHAQAITSASDRFREIIQDLKKA